MFFLDYGSFFLGHYSIIKQLILIWEDLKMYTLGLNKIALRMASNKTHVTSTMGLRTVEVNSKSVFCSAVAKNHGNRIVRG